MSDPTEIASMRRAFRLSAAPPKPESCPSPETLWAAFHGELSPAEVRQVVDHSAACSACAEDWRMALALEGEVQTEEEEDECNPREETQTVSPPTYYGHLRRFKAWVAVPIAAVAASLIMIAQWGAKPPSAIDAFRGGDQAVVASPAPAKLLRRDCVLSWPAVPRTVSYQVTVEAGAGALDLQKAVKEPSLRLEPSQLVKLPKRTEIRWTVDAILANGDRIQLQTFHAPLE